MVPVSSVERRPKQISMSDRASRSPIYVREILVYTVHNMDRQEQSVLRCAVVES